MRYRPARLGTLSAVLFALFFSVVVYADQPQVELDTSAGKIVIQLDADRAPITVANFLQYVDDGFYDGTLFHRVIDGFMVQGGGFDQQLQRKTTRQPIKNEATNGLKNYRFSIAMARTQKPHSATAQFFINTEDNAFLDHKSPSGNGWGYAVFGKIVEGTEVIEEISTVPTSAKGPLPSDVPVDDIIIKKASRVTP